jgi:hypothetical protein
VRPRSRFIGRARTTCRYRSDSTLLLLPISELKADTIEGHIVTGIMQLTMTHIAVVRMSVAGGTAAHITAAHGWTCVAMAAPTTEQAHPI